MYPIQSYQPKYAIGIIQPTQSRTKIRRKKKKEKKNLIKERYSETISYITVRISVSVDPF